MGEESLHISLSPWTPKKNPFRHLGAQTMLHALAIAYRLRLLLISIPNHLVLMASNLAVLLG